MIFYDVDLHERVLFEFHLTELDWRLLRTCPKFALHSTVTESEKVGAIERDTTNVFKPGDFVYYMFIFPHYKCLYF